MAEELQSLRTQEASNQLAMTHLKKKLESYKERLETLQSEKANLHNELNNFESLSATSKNERIAE